MSKQFPQHEMLTYEKELLGFYVSGHPLDDYKGIAEALTNFEIDKMDQLGDRVEFQICGVASGVTKKLARKDNRPWAFFNVGTLKGTVLMNCYADAFGEYGHNLDNEKLVLVKGSVFRNEEGVRLSVSEIYPLETSLADQVKHITWILDQRVTPNGFSTTIEKRWTQRGVALPATSPSAWIRIRSSRHPPHPLFAGK